MKIDTVHDNIIEKESLEYLRGTLWNFLVIGNFLDLSQKKLTKKAKVYKNHTKSDFSFDFRKLVQKTNVA